MEQSPLKSGIQARQETEDTVEAGPEMRITVLTVAILALIGILLIFTGYQAADTERAFFREVALNANQEIATLVGRQFAQTFTNCTGLLEDLARYPSAVSHDLSMLDQLFGVLLKRHDIFRVIYFLDENLVPIKVRYNIGATAYRPLPAEKLALLKRREVHRVLSDFYKSEEDPALTFACSVMDRQDAFRGVVVAELDLNFIQDILTSVRVGRTGEILLVDRAGSVIFSSPGFSGLAEFKNFRIKAAFERDRGMGEYGSSVHRLAAHQRIRVLPLKPIWDPTGLGGQIPYTAETIPDWLVVVQQQSAEAYAVSDRMKYNLFILVVVGVIGLVVIARLWLESL